MPMVSRPARRHREMNPSTFLWVTSFIGGVQLLFQFCHHLIGYGALEGTLQPFGLLCLAEALDLAAEIGSSTGHPPGGVYMDLALRGMDNAYQLFLGKCSPQPAHILTGIFFCCTVGASFLYDYSSLAGSSSP